MPELPEIETIKLQLGKVLVGQRIVNVIVNNNKSVRGDIGEIRGRRVIGIRRMAKVLLIDLDGDLTIAIHLKMTGQLIYDDGKGRVAGGHPTGDFAGELPSKHTRVMIELTSPPATLYFNDQRKFGWMKIVESSKLKVESFIKDLGPEPLELKKDEVIKLIKLIKKSKRAIKLVIMDQKIISGVGNIYANDALWEARIRPQTVANQISVERLRILLKKIHLVLREGIKYGGATAADSKFVNLQGMGGHYQDHFRVYDRRGLPCLKCQTEIKKITLGGRGTYYCSKCQIV